MEWITQTLKNRSAFEVSVLRSSNKHGQSSWGWKSDSKILIHVDTLEFAELCAEMLCSALNALPEPPKGD